jgi:hypothetical protein
MLTGDGWRFSAGLARWLTICRSAPASALQPFAQLQLVCTSAYGLILFAEPLRPTTFIGAAIVIGAGLFALSAGRGGAGLTSVQPVQFVAKAIQRPDKMMAIHSEADRTPATRPVAVSIQRSGPPRRLKTTALAPAANSRPSLTSMAGFSP